MPDGNGHVMLDSAYDVYRNYRVIYDSGKKPAVWPCEGSTAKGFSTRAEMIRWLERDPEESGKVYRQRSLVESAFSAIYP